LKAVKYCKQLYLFNLSRHNRQNNAGYYNPVGVIFLLYLKNVCNQTVDVT